eukprot:s709_g16.t1
MSHSKQLSPRRLCKVNETASSCLLAKYTERNAGKQSPVISKVGDTAADILFLTGMLWCSSVIHKKGLMEGNIVETSLKPRLLTVDHYLPVPVFACICRLRRICTTLWQINLDS